MKQPIKRRHKKALFHRKVEKGFNLVSENQQDIYNAIMVQDREIKALRSEVKTLRTVCDRD